MMVMPTAADDLISLSFQSPLQTRLHMGPRQLINRSLSAPSPQTLFACFLQVMSVSGTFSLAYPPWVFVFLKIHPRIRMHRFIFYPIHRGSEFTHLLNITPWERCIRLHRQKTCGKD
jgi:hypothetical protein